VTPAGRTSSWSRASAGASTSSSSTGTSQVGSVTECHPPRSNKASGSVQTTYTESLPGARCPNAESSLPRRTEHHSPSKRRAHLGVLDDRCVVLSSIDGSLLEPEGLFEERDGASSIPVRKDGPNGCVTRHAVTINDSAPLPLGNGTSSTSSSRRAAGQLGEVAVHVDLVVVARRRRHMCDRDERGHGLKHPAGSFEPDDASCQLRAESKLVTESACQMPAGIACFRHQFFDGGLAPDERSSLQPPRSSGAISPPSLLRRSNTSSHVANRSSHEPGSCIRSRNSPPIPPNDFVELVRTVPELSRRRVDKGPAAMRGQLDGYAFLMPRHVRSAPSAPEVRRERNDTGPGAVVGFVRATTSIWRQSRR
jgi:hypothetical protein